MTPGHHSISGVPSVIISTLVHSSPRKAVCILGISPWATTIIEEIYLEHQVVVHARRHAPA